MDKTQVGYQRLFDVLHAKMMNAGLLWAPQFFISDFEPAILNSARIAFPGITILGCYFHFCQCLWRQVQALGLAGTFRQNRPVRHTIKLLMALGYLPLSFVKIQFNNLRARKTQLLNQFPALEQFFGYVERNWIRSSSANPPAIWNVFGRPMDRRTNNSVESFNKHWNMRVGIRRPSLWTFIRILKDEQTHHQRNVRNMNNGVAPVCRRRRWREHERKIIKLRADLQSGNRNLPNYWQAITFTVSNN